MGTNFSQCCASSSLRSSGDGDAPATQSSDGAFEDKGCQTMACKILPCDEEEDARKAAEEAARLAAEKKKLEADKVAAELAEKVALAETKAAFKTKYLAEVKAAEKAAAATKQLAKKVAGELRSLKPANIKKAQTKVKEEIDVQKNIWKDMGRFKGKEYTVQMDAHHVEISRFLNVCSTSSLDLTLVYCQKHKDDIGESLVKKVEEARDSIHASELDTLAEQLELISAGKKATEDPDVVKALISKCELTGAMEALLAKVDKKYDKEAQRREEKALEDAKLEDEIRKEKAKGGSKNGSRSNSGVLGTPRLERRNSSDGAPSAPSVASKPVPSLRSASMPVSSSTSIKADPAKDAQEARNKLREEIQTAQNIWASMAAFKDKAYKAKTEEIGQKMHSILAQEVGKPLGDASALEKLKAFITEEEEFFNRGMLQLVQKAIDAAQLMQKVSSGKPLTLTLTRSQSKQVSEAHTKLKDEITTATNIWGSMAAFKDKAYKSKTEGLAQKLHSLLAQDEAKAPGDTSALEQIRACCSEEAELFNPRVLEHVQKMIDDTALMKK